MHSRFNSYLLHILDLNPDGYNSRIRPLSIYIFLSSLYNLAEQVPALERNNACILYSYKWIKSYCIAKREQVLIIKKEWNRNNFPLLN